LTLKKATSVSKNACTETFIASNTQKPLLSKTFQNLYLLNSSQSFRKFLDTTNYPSPINNRKTTNFSRRFTSPFIKAFRRRQSTPKNQTFHLYFIVNLTTNVSKTQKENINQESTINAKQSEVFIARFRL
jgi:hypothetical protein